MIKILFILIWLFPFSALADQEPDLCYYVEHKPEAVKYVPDEDFETNSYLPDEYNFSIKVDLSKYNQGKYSDFVDKEMKLIDVKITEDGKVFFDDKEVTQKVRDSCKPKAGQIVIDGVSFE